MGLEGWGLCEGRRGDRRAYPVGQRICQPGRARPHAVRLAINAGVRITGFKGAITRLRVLLDNPTKVIGIDGVFEYLIFKILKLLCF